jgi:3D-(3,5/4)-trihydroxycyclohexane-1,2-dione acylhydrolase (decyclizing)
LPGDEAGSEVLPLPVDLAENARSLGAYVIRCRDSADVMSALETARSLDRTTLIYVQCDRYESVPAYESWWDVAVAEVSSSPQVQAARREWELMRTEERYFL